MVEEEEEGGGGVEKESKSERGGRLGTQLLDRHTCLHGDFEIVSGRFN